jgi:hypothetical protein
MTIRDLFSHKIHSSGDDWPEKLTELAAIFAEFDGQPYDRQAFETRLQSISPRASYLAAAGTRRTPGGRLDASKFRDEISAYPAYLGLYFLQQSAAGWIVKLSETARRFLVREEPDVASFLRLQLPLFQYPNAMGAAYRGATNKLRLQVNAARRTLEFIRNGIHFSPVRLIAVALKADASIRGVSALQASVSFQEIFGLVNTKPINQHALPEIKAVARYLDGIRLGKLSNAAPPNYENRFHTLRHTEMFLVERGTVKLRDSVNEVDRAQLLRQLDAICAIDDQFNGFDDCSRTRDIEAVIATGGWGRYFDGVRVLPSDVVEALTNDQALESTMPLEPERLGESPTLPQPVAEVYPLRERTTSPPTIRPYDRRREMADPELTRIKRQRRNLAHKELIDKMDAWLRRLGANPKENEHIDLFAKIPKDGSFIFEMKSGGDSILDQIRKGLSQLYEYRYRYREVIGGDDVSLCLVLPHPPTTPWLADYLCKDRDINICWFEGSDNLAWHVLCGESMGPLASGTSPTALP